jgi:predicted membrane channel-forming protein YqfA (hemolysin III family)
MNKYLKFLGIALIILGAILLVLPMLITPMADLADYNWYTVGNLALMIIGLILHITLNKKLEY